MALILCLFTSGLWLWKRRERMTSYPIESPPSTYGDGFRERSASTATDQKTLVASVPNSPQYTSFHEQREQALTAAYAQSVPSSKMLDHNQYDMQERAMDRQSLNEAAGHESRSTEKSLPLPPTDMPLPPRPVKYTINVNINKSMIFDDVLFNMASTPRDPGVPRDSGASRERMPKYRFEEYHPPITDIPPISIRQISSKRMPEIEMRPYPPQDSSLTSQSASDDSKDDAEVGLKRQSTLKRMDSKPPQLPMLELLPLASPSFSFTPPAQLPMPDLLPPPSPSFSFTSYDWYQDIIGTEHTNMEDGTFGTVPWIPTPTQATFGAVCTSTPPRLHASLMPAPLSLMAPPLLAGASFLHPSTAALISPTSSNFQLSPTVYEMPSRPPKAQPMRASLRSIMTQQTRASSHLLPDDGLYLPEEGTQATYMMSRGNLDDDSRPTSYTPLY
ncbi:hypothetical protein ACEQ8H_001726 [Pleosporales sp. CAS-2024a]